MGDLERFNTKWIVNPETGCHEWTGGLDTHGYGQFWLSGKNTPAHKAVFILNGIERDAALTVDHKCRVRRCVNLDHLEQVSTQENTARREHHNLKKERCPEGHDYSRKKDGSRYCKTCHAKRVREARHARRVANPS